LIEMMIAALEEHKKSKDWIRDGGQYIPHPERWIKNCRWEDDLNIEVDPLPYSETTSKNIQLFKEWTPEG